MFLLKGENGGDMVLVHNPATGGVHAHAVTADGRYVAREYLLEQVLRGAIWALTD